MMLRGVPDGEPPTLTLSAAGDRSNPWTPIWLVASEPLPEQQMLPVLRSPSGDVITFLSPAQPRIRSSIVFGKPSRMLRFGEEYRVTFEGVTDLAGKRPAPSDPPMFTTRRAAADRRRRIRIGHGRHARRRASDYGAGAPVIAGARSLYIPPAALARGADAARGAPGLGAGPEVRPLRLQDREPHRHLRLLDRGRRRRNDRDRDAGVRGRRPDDAGDDRGTQVSLGPTRSVEIVIPPDARGEVVVARDRHPGRALRRPAAACRPRWQSSTTSASNEGRHPVANRDISIRTGPSNPREAAGNERA